MQNPRFRYNDRNNRVEANVSGATTILEPSESELEKLPSYEELMEIIFVPKSIESLLEDERSEAPARLPAGGADSRGSGKHCQGYSQYDN